MKINFTWDIARDTNEIEIIANPVNKEKLWTLKEGLSSNSTINVQNPKNNRKLSIRIQQIEVITSLGHLSKVILSNQEEYLLDMRLKELKQFEANGLFRINNSTILNLSQISSFRSGDYARLEVYTKNDKKYLVSRHYAKLIKERLS
ncbi:hypothetical protein Q75_00220 [Bacillus coahuilensis p1.1.43]|uniref:HTH LytTR-type domain-containing protein n=1 Tax=Bacillus coahuilensis p1.1.43 TaxID=1150625 RepID=A0A147KCK2_9BACI|nr:LytTR family DNA-binding domain-containing protein [Bacillus coahuilensis]KUP09390.1 hypothetical protein Q75_00220 [Bacillus coahuilensis p1.1.43]